MKPNHPLLYKKLLLTIILAFLSFNIIAQPEPCPNPAPPGADNCEDACVYCDLTANGYVGSTIGYTPDAPNIYCGTIENNQWFAFAAGTTTVEFTIIASNCQNGDGVQGAIYPDCDPNSQWIACDGGQNNGDDIPIVVTATDLVIGDIYWFMVDGWLGDQCDYDVTVTQGNTDPPPLDPPGPIDAPPLGCTGQTVTFSVPELPGASYYEWTLPDGSMVTTEEPFVDYTFGVGGQVCVIASNVCNLSDEVCISIDLYEPDAGALTINPNPLCPNETATITVSGYNADPEFTQNILIADANGIIINIINGDNATFTHDACDEFQVCTYNYVTSEGQVPMVGDDVNTYNCDEECCDMNCQNLSFEDTEAPTFPNGPGDLTLTCFDLLPAMTDQEWLDNCEGTGMVPGTESGSADLCAGGTIQRMWEYTDTCGNTGTHTQSITIDPPPVPTFVNPPGDMTVDCENIPTGGVDLDYTNNGEGDCLIEGTITPTESGSADICGGTITYTWDFTDACGNNINHVQNFTVNPAPAPEFLNPPADVTLDCDNVPSTGPDLVYTNSASGDCLIEGNVYPTESGSADICGGTIIYTWDFTDVCGNNINHVQSVTIEPAPLPEFINPPADVTVDCDNVPTGAPELDYTNNANGDCLIDGTITPVQEGDADICGGTILYRWQFTDPCGNIITHDQNYTITPAPEPMFINPPADITFDCDNIPTNGPDLDYTNNGPGDCLIEGTISPVESGSADICGGTITYTWDFTDECGNNINHVQNITIEPADEPAFINPPADVTFDCDNIPTGAPDLDYTNNGTGDCLIEGAVSPTQTGNADICGGQFSFNWEFTDQCGNTIQHTQNIEITPAPDVSFINPPGDINTSCNNFPGNPGDLNYTNNGVGDCLIEGVVSPVQSGGYDECGGTVTFTWEFTSQCGQTITHVQSVVVEPAPQAEFTGNLPQGMTVDCDNVPTLPGPLDYTNNETGICLIEGSQPATQSGGYDECGGTIFFLWQFTDDCNRTISHQQTITVEPAPEASFTDLPGPITLDCSEVPADPPTLDYTNNLSGTCGISGTVPAIQSGSYTSCGGTITYSWVFTDDCNRTINHSQTVTVNPASDPYFINLPPDLTIDCGEPLPPANALPYTNDESGPCEISGSAPVIINYIDDLTTEYFWTYTNPCNGATIQHTQVISENPSPEITLTPNQTIICEGDFFDLSTIFVSDQNNTNLTISYHSGTPANSGNELPSPNVNPLQSTIYFILATNEFGCTDEEIFSIVVEEPPFAGGDGTGELCYDVATSVNLFNYLTGNPLQSGQWQDITNSGVDISNPYNVDFTGFPSGIYLFLYSLPSNGVCPNDEAVVTIELLPEVEVDIISIACSGDPDFYEILLNSNGYIVVSDQGVLNDIGNNEILISDIPIGQTTLIYAFDPLNPDCINFVSINSPNCDCPDVDPPLNNGDLSICEGEPNPELSVTVGANETANWYDNLVGGILLIAGSTIYTPDTSAVGVYTYYVEAENLLDSCLSLILTPVQFEILPSPSGNDAQLEECDDDYDGFTLFDLTQAEDQISSNQSYSFSYYETMGDAENGTNPISVLYTNITTPSQEIFVAITDPNNCTSIVSLTLIVAALPDISLDLSDESCLGDGDGIMNVTSAEGINYSLDSINWTTETLFDSLVPGDYTIYVEGNNGCLVSEDFTIVPGLELEMASFEIICDNNGTPSDANDDFYTITFTLGNSLNAPGSYTINDGTSDLGTFNYDEQSSIIIPALGQILTLNFSDDLLGCPIQQTVGPLNSCSTDCIISINQLDFECSDNGTPSDSSDDFYTISINASAINGSANSTYNVLIDGVLNYNFTYDLTSTFTLPADGSSPTITVVDNEDPQCLASQSIGPLDSCSGLCVIDFTALELFCNDNGTISNQTDDFYEVTINATAINASPTNNFIVLVDGVPSGTFVYGTGGTIILPADGSSPIITIVDETDDNCTAEQQIGPLDPCTDECIIIATVSNIECDNQGTDNDPSDDTYTFDLMVTGQNVSSGWQTDDGNYAGNYDELLALGPFLIINGNIVFNILDNGNPDCNVQITADAPPSCSDACEINFTVFDVFCNDNGTISNQTDDFYEITINASAINGGPNNIFEVLVDGMLAGSFTYGTGGTIILPADGSSPTITIVDENISTCSAEQQIGPLEPCTDECTINAVITNILCDDQGTGDPDDDTFSFELLVSGQNTSSGWELDNGSYSGSYGVAQTLGPFLISNGNQILTILDSGNPDCNFEITAIAPPTCSNCTQTADAGTGAILDCDNETVVLNASSSEPGEYLWTGPNMFEATTLTIVVSQAGTYYFSVTYPDNCVVEDSLVVGINDDVPIADAGPDQILNCDVDQVYLDGSLSNQGADILYFWTNGDGDTISQNIGVTVSIGGTYYLQLIDTVSNCLSQIDEVDVFVDVSVPTAVIYADPNNILDCTVSSILLYTDDQDNVYYIWSSSSGTVTADQIIISEPDIYTLLAIDTISGCENTDFIIIEDLGDYPYVNINPVDTLSCYFPEILIDATGSQTGVNILYNWFDGQNNLIIGENGDTLIVDEEGFYYLQLIDTINGCENMDTVFVESLLDQVPIAAIDQIGALDCNGSSLVLDGSGSTPFNNLIFEWSTSNGNIVSGENTPNPEIDQGGLYTLIVTDFISGCTNDESINIDEDMEVPIVVILPPGLINCYNSEIEIDASNSSSFGNFVYSWISNPPGGIVSGGNTLNPTIDQGGTYTLTIVNLDNGCTESGLIEVEEDTELPIAIANAFDELDCITEEVQLSGDGSSTGTQFSYSWTGIGIISGSTTLQPMVNLPGSFILTVFNAQNGCENTDEVVVNENTNVPVGLEAIVTPPICFGDGGSIEILSVDGGEEPYVYSVNNGVTYFPWSYFASLQPGDYTVVVQDANGCEYEEYFFIPSVPELIVDLEAEIIVQLGESTQLFAFVNISPSQIDTIVWTPTEYLSCTNCLNPFVETPLDEIAYQVTVTDLDGCTAADQIMLRVKKDRDIYIPNAFSPHNNDGINDFFMIFGNEDIVAKINTFQVFDRWGELVWEDYDFQPNDPAHSWDGYLKGKPMNPAVFVYWAEIEFIDGVKKLYKGDVTLMR